MDLSPLRKFEVTGPDAEALLQYALTRDVREARRGQVVYTAMCYEHGGMIDDGTVFRLGQNNFRWIGGDEFGGLWLREQAQKLGFTAWVRSSTDQLHNIAVQGPKSRDILKEIIWTPPAQPALGELEWFRFAVGRIGDFDGVPVVVSRTGYTGELGYEIFCHPQGRGAPCSTRCGRPASRTACRRSGLQALDMVRIEAGLIFANYEFSDQTDPFEAGIGFTVPLKTKTDDFVGREALIQRKAHPQQKLVGLDIDANEAVGHGDCVHVGRAQIGVVTSGMRSPILKKNIALARLDVTPCRIGTEVEIGKLDGHQKRLPARIVRSRTTTRRRPGRGRRDDAGASQPAIISAPRSWRRPSGPCRCGGRAQIPAARTSRPFRCAGMTTRPSGPRRLRDSFPPFLRRDARSAPAHPRERRRPRPCGDTPCRRRNR